MFLVGWEDVARAALVAWLGAKQQRATKDWYGIRVRAEVISATAMRLRTQMCGDQDLARW
jgi:hypothetical protein